MKRIWFEMHINCRPICRLFARRIVAVCFKETENQGRRMVASEWPVAYRRYSLDYVADEVAGMSRSMLKFAERTLRGFSR